MQFLFAYQGCDLAYNRIQIANGEVWRTLSGHFLHFNWTHWFLNSSALLLIVSIFHESWSWKTLLSSLTFSALCISACLWFISDDLKRYVGLSACLYALLVTSLIMDRSLSTRLRLSVWITLLLKLLVDHSQPQLSMAKLIGGPVAVDSHVYGVLSGLANGALLSLKRKATTGTLPNKLQSP